MSHLNGVGIFVCFIIGWGRGGTRIIAGGGYMHANRQGAMPLSCCAYVQSGSWAEVIAAISCQFQYFCVDDRWQKTGNRSAANGIGG